MNGDFFFEIIFKKMNVMDNRGNLFFRDVVFGRKIYSGV